MKTSLVFLWTLIAGPLLAAVSGFSAVAANPAMAVIQDDPALPRVLLIGDSISIGYTLPVRTKLKGIANVHRIPENGGPTTTGLAHLDRWLGTNHWDVIHFNWGLHDLKVMTNGQHMVPLSDYEANLDRLAQRLEATGAKLIWCSTTPVPDAKLNPPRKPADVLLYNQAAARVAARHHCQIDDLHAVAAPQLSSLQLPANVHFSKEGSAVLAEAVAESIKQALPKTKSRSP